MNLVELGEVKEYLKISSNTDDNRLSNIISYASELINNYCSRDLAANVFTEYLDGGSYSVFVRNTPINNVQSLYEYDGTDYVELTGPNSDGSLPSQNANANVIQYVWYSDTGQIVKGFQTRPDISISGRDLFNKYPKGIKVTYGGGYLNIPMDLKLATLDLIKQLHKNILENQATSLNGEYKAVFAYSGGFSPHIRRILDLYRNVM